MMVQRCPNLLRHIIQAMVNLIFSSLQIINSRQKRSIGDLDNSSNHLYVVSPLPSSILLHFLRICRNSGTRYFFLVISFCKLRKGHGIVILRPSSKTTFCRFTNDDTRIPVGLINQGATCYMNAALQILFSTKSLRKANCCVQKTTHCILFYRPYWN